MIETLPYSVARTMMQSGDVILKAGEGKISWMIGLWAPKQVKDMAGNIIEAKLTHGALVVRLDDYVRNHEVFVVEANESGLVPRLLSKQLQGSDSRWFWLQVAMTDSQRALSREIALIHSAYGIKYDYQGLFANAFGKVSVEASRFFCTEWIDFNWSECGFINPYGGKAFRPWDVPQYGVMREIVG